MLDVKPIEVSHEVEAKEVVEKFWPRLNQQRPPSFSLTHRPNGRYWVNLLVSNLGNQDDQLYSGVLLADSRGEPAAIQFSCHTPRCEEYTAENEEWTYFFHGATVSKGIVPT